MSKLKKIPLIILPIIYYLVIALLFVFVVPKGGDLISSHGDYVLGEIGGYMFLIFLLIDIFRFIKRKK